MKKIAVSILLSILLLVSLCACSGSEEATPELDTEKQEAVQEEIAAPAPEQETLDEMQQSAAEASLALMIAANASDTEAEEPEDNPEEEPEPTTEEPSAVEEPEQEDATVAEEEPKPEENQELEEPQKPAEETPAPTIKEPDPVQDPEPSSPQVQDMVYITETGTKYHNAGCRHLKDSKIEISKSDAVAKGYEPCKTCH